MFVHKIDEELSLKLIDMRDAEKVFALTNNSRDYLKEWLPWLEKTKKIEDTHEYIKASLKDFAEDKSMNTVILYKNEIVGIAGFNQLDWSNKLAYIGYWLDKDFQGKGIMTRVSKALTDYAFNELNMNKVEIRAASENKKSRSVPERLDFVEEGHIRQAEYLYDHYVDLVVYGILAEEWKK
ncbi:GNAT family N-acetyltransferase [Saliterribacillus persicus]|uniref:Ribosomal-protein-serine acetyltransferase n=1 Tax=Saliterribacillus persicus TaxID=930114 RepID=A0A368X949_9BACI|nr:GNAT family protein [Saliterribacillus persicus]RCW62564.1 ribosomal-protein-serine acetyltransferase [Saliterribacillus persicus]